MPLAPVAERFAPVVPFQVVRFNALCIRTNISVMVHVPLVVWHFVGRCMIRHSVWRESHLKSPPPGASYRFERHDLLLHGKDLKRNHATLYSPVPASPAHTDISAIESARDRYFNENFVLIARTWAPFRRILPQLESLLARSNVSKRDHYPFKPAS